MFPVIFFPSIGLDEDDLTTISYPLSGSGLADDDTIWVNLTLESNQSFIELGFTGEITTPTSLHLLKSPASNYTVTSGKTAKIIMLVKFATTSGTFTVHEDSTADAGTGTTKYTSNSQVINSLTTVIIDSIAASKYVTIDTTGGVRILGAIAIET